MKTHYGSVERANESDNHDYWSETLCGLEYADDMTDREEYVTCKKCLKKIEKSNGQKIQKSDSRIIAPDF